MKEEPEVMEAVPEPDNQNDKGDGQGAPGPQSHRDLQRWALQELVALANECAHLEAEMDRLLSESLSQTQAKEQKDRSKLEWDLKSLNEQVVQKFEERRTQIETRYQQTLATLKTNENSSRKRALAEFEALQQDVKQKYQQAAWLAESVLEAAEAKAAEELKKATELHAIQVEQLNAKEAEAQALMNRYNQRPPAGERLFCQAQRNDRSPNSSVGIAYCSQAVCWRGAIPHFHRGAAAGRCGPAGGEGDADAPVAAHRYRGGGGGGHPGGCVFSSAVDGAQTGCNGIYPVAPRPGCGPGGQRQHAQSGLDAA